MAASRGMAEHKIGHDQLESTLSEENINEWTVDIETWERDTSQPNPFTVNATGMHLYTHVSQTTKIRDQKDQLWLLSCVS